MRQGKQIHQGYSFFWGVFLLLVMSAAISIHAEAPSTKELVLFKDTLKNDTIVPQSPKKNGTFVIRDRIPIPSDEPLFIVNGMELPYEIFAALNPAHIESLEVLKDASLILFSNLVSSCSFSSNCSCCLLILFNLFRSLYR